MVGSSIGRTDLPEVGKRRLEPWALPEANDSEVRQPWPPLALVDAQTLQPAL